MADGTAIIIVNETCKVKVNETVKVKDNETVIDAKRRGADTDFKNMKTMFEELGFKVIPHFNKTCSEIEEAFQQASSIQSDILVFVISTHGEESHQKKANIKSDGTKVNDQMAVGSDKQNIKSDGTKGQDQMIVVSDGQNIKSDGTKVYDQMIYGYDGVTISVNDLLKQLDNDALRGKTKLCFIQACRSIEGMKGTDLGVTVKVAGGKEIHKAKVDDIADDMGADGEDEIDKGVGDTGVMPKLPETDIGEGVIGGMPKLPEPVIGEGDIGVIPKLPETQKEPVKSMDDAKSEIAPDECDSDIAIAPVECPRDCLVMYGVQPHKYALRSPTKGSLMLHYMFEERHILKQDDGNVLMYLTNVLRKMADRTSKFKGQKVKTCGTIYHRLTREVFMRKK